MRPTMACSAGASETRGCQSGGRIRTSLARGASPRGRYPAFWHTTATPLTKYLTGVLELSRGLTDVQLDQPFDVGHVTLRATFEHMIFNVEIWAESMAEQLVDVQRDDRSRAALVERHERSYATFATVARRVRDEQRLEDTFVDPWTQSATRRTFGGTIIHVILHNTQHRSE